MGDFFFKDSTGGKSPFFTTIWVVKTLKLWGLSGFHGAFNWGLLEDMFRSCQIAPRPTFWIFGGYRLESKHGYKDLNNSRVWIIVWFVWLLGLFLMLNVNGVVSLRQNVEIPVICKKPMPLWMRPHFETSVQNFSGKCNLNPYILPKYTWTPK